MPPTQDPGAGEARAHQDEDQTIFEALRRDHLTLTRLLEQMRSPTPAGAGEAAAMLRVLKDEVLVHTWAEDDVFYERLVESEDDALRESVEEARAEHAELEEILAELEAIEVQSDRWRERLDALREGLSRHLAHEEADLFERASEIIGGDEQRALAHEFHVAREQIASEKRAAEFEEQQPLLELGDSEFRGPA